MNSDFWDVFVIGAFMGLKIYCGLLPLAMIIHHIKKSP